jgi:hypothetical protein
MLTAQEKQSILSNAYVPEHSVDLMTGVSGGEAFFDDEYFFCCKGDWMIVVGYPLNDEFNVDEFDLFVSGLIRRFRPAQLSLVASEIPDSLLAQSNEKDSDYYYVLDLSAGEPSGRLKRIVRKASEKLSIERADSMHEAHHLLMHEFIERVDPPRRVVRLLWKMPDYIQKQPDGLVLNAWDDRQRLAAFYIVDTAPRHFSTYVIGCHSRQNYVSGASDLLVYELTALSREFGKQYIHLGLGVNEGIRRFKKKWGGVPTRRYEMCDIRVRKPAVTESIKAYLNSARFNQT